MSVSPKSVHIIHKLNFYLNTKYWSKIVLARIEFRTWDWQSRLSTAQVRIRETACLSVIWQILMGVPLLPTYPRRSKHSTIAQ